MYEYYIGFELNKYQIKASNLIVDNFLQSKNILLDAVCGAGKTEMLLELIKISLNKGYKIGFACPRRQLIIDLYKRIAIYFNTLEFGIHIGNKQTNLDSDLIFLTTHQLVKYQNKFDLLIIDEIDAFPFYNNLELEKACLNSSKQFVFLSATVPDKYLSLVKRNKLVLISNYFRHHLKCIPLPCIKRYRILFINLIYYTLKYKKDKLIIYVASIKQGQRIKGFLRMFNHNIKFVYGKNINNKIIDDFNNNKINILISTTVLERGMTFKKVDVLVVDANNTKIFDVSCLLQICGRVGRDTKYHQGNIYFLARKLSDNMIKTRERIIQYNEMYDM